MRANTHLQPLADGFAVLERMQADGIQPERYVVTTLMALIARLARLGKATVADAEAFMQQVRCTYHREPQSTLGGAPRFSQSHRCRLQAARGAS